MTRPSAIKGDTARMLLENFWISPVQINNQLRIKILKFLLSDSWVWTKSWVPRKMMVIAETKFLIMYNDLKLI